MSSSSFGVYHLALTTYKSVTARDLYLLNITLQCTSRCDAEGQAARLYMYSLLVQYAIVSILLDAEIWFNDVIPAYRC
jgi:hypothetical protein